MPIRFLLLALLAVACGSPAQQAGVGQECGDDDDCDDDQTCLDFAGGYCGLQDCDDDGDCPGGSACVEHTDGERYCFLQCVDKAECNGGRSADNEANCSANVTFVEQDEGVKACVPPSSG
ncbi:MAG: hypothetical protein Q8O67_03005 [Deltaproteobacteria bacterium]|nr:hypothetical protein [Deltaproteobacteria bacterium]